MTRPHIGPGSLATGERSTPLACARLGRGRCVACGSMLGFWPASLPRSLFEPTGLRRRASRGSERTARPPYEGLWASSEAACRDEDGVERMEIGRGRLFWYETRCRADGIKAAGPRSWTMRLSCEGEGQRFSARPRLTLATPDRLIIERSPV